MDATTTVTYQDTPRLGESGDTPTYIARRKLSAAHRRMLEVDSAIIPSVIEERGTFTAPRGADVPQGDGWLPRKPGMVLPIHTLDGGIFHRHRPDNPGPYPKYMQPRGRANRLDVHPCQHQRIKLPGGMRYVTEGERKTDAGVSRGLLMVGLSGVWNGQKNKELIPDWDYLPIEGEQYCITFDSDITENSHVQQAADRQARLLRERGAEVYITLLPPAADGSKQGLDDFFVNGGTVKELELLTQPYAPLAIQKARLSRDEKLRARIEDLERRHRDTRWTWRGGDADEDVYLMLMDATRKHGKIHADGLRVVKAQGPLALEAKISTRTLYKSLNRLEERGFLYRDNEGRKADKAGAFVLRANVSQGGEERGREEGLLREQARGDLHSRGPRLRNSRPKFKPTKKQIHAHRIGKLTLLPELREGLRRVGKRRGHALDRLDLAGGTLTLEALGELLGIRPRELMRRKTSEKGRDGVLLRLVENGIITIEGDTVSLTPGWLTALERQRGLGEELEAESVARRRYRDKAHAYHNRDKVPESKPSAAGLKLIKGANAKRRAHLRETARADAERRKAGPPPALVALISGKLRQLGRLRMGLLIELAADKGHDHRIVPEVVGGMGCRVERLAEYDDAEFVFAPAPVPAPTPEPTPAPAPAPEPAPTIEARSAPTPRPAPAPARKPPPAPDPEPVEHGLACECPECVAPAPVYARPARSSGRSVEGTV